MWQYSNQAMPHRTNMPAITLARIDVTRNMRRFYLIDVQPDLFGEWSLIREWGRLGQSGRRHIDVYPSESAAVTALERQAYIKRRRGYCLIAGNTAMWQTGNTAADIR
jgi:predicted DNA-binding WGR domain protein